MSTRFYLFVLMGCLIIASGCNQDEKKVPSVTTEKKPDMMDPFRYHKMIEVSPGQDFDILSWGRGSTTVGAFLILRSDSSGKKYTTTTGDLDGAIVDVYNSDMDLDGNPEILIQAKSKDTTNYATIYAFEFNGSKAQKLDFPRLTTSQRKGYRGNDNFYIREGKFMREFPLYDGNGNGKDAKPTGQKRVLEYGLRSNSFTVKQLSKDSPETNATGPVAKEPVKTASSANTQTTTTKKSTKHTASKKHKKKKHRRQQSSE